MMANRFSPGAIFSPSQARQQLAQARDWSYIDDWLSKLYRSQPVPPFERNAETLKVLLALVAANESAEEEKELVYRLEGRALAELDTDVETAPDVELLQCLQSNLTKDGHESLDAVASAAVELGALKAEPERLIVDILELSRSEFNMEQYAQRMHSIQAYLGSELLRLERETAKFQNDSFQVSPSLPQRTAEWTRATRQLAAKLLDYKERASGLSHGEEPRPGIAKIHTLEKDALALQADVQGLEQRVADFHGLPPRQELAKKEAEQARRELQDLTRTRDRLFEGLVEEN